MRRVLIACGGTGGHFYPGYVLGRALRERGWEPLFLLRRQDPSGPRLDREGLAYAELDMRGMPRGLLGPWPAFLGGLVRSLRVTRNILRSWRPACVAGMGGYLTVPAALAARGRAPLVLHEANAALGLANRLALPFASRLAMGLPLERLPRLPPSPPAVLTGTPVRPTLWRLPELREARASLGLDAHKPTLLVFGGSQGARAVNRLAPEAARLLARERPGSFQCLHLSGAPEEGAVRAAYAAAGIQAVVRPYLQEMELAYAAADLVLCRAGASTLAELAAARKPALLIPYPWAAGRHQQANAAVLAEAGATRTLEEAGLDAGALASSLSQLLFSPGALQEMGRRYASLGLPAPDKALDSLIELVEEASR